MAACSSLSISGDAMEVYVEVGRRDEKKLGLSTHVSIVLQARNGRGFPFKKGFVRPGFRLRISPWEEQVDPDRVETARYRAVFVLGRRRGLGFSPVDSSGIAFQAVTEHANHDYAGFVVLVLNEMVPVLLDTAARTSTANAENEYEKKAKSRIVQLRTKRSDSCLTALPKPLGRDLGILRLRRRNRSFEDFLHHPFDGDMLLFRLLCGTVNLVQRGNPVDDFP